MTVTETEVAQTIMSLKSSRTKDIFGMDTFVLKELCSSLTSPLTTILNQSISESIFPSAWKSSVVIPIYKNGDSMLLSNYRPISIIPTVSKITEKLIAQQIIEHLNNTSFSLHPMQFGFRALHSTETANCFFTENIKQLLDKGGVVGAVFLDLKKAFDTINHKKLLTKLTKFNFSSSTIKWIESYLSKRSQSVRINHYHSSPLPISTGVPQGSILGPLLFSLYINDLPSVCSNAFTQMYADDTVIYSHGNNTSEVAEKLTETMGHVAKWLEQSSLCLNVNKTVAMFFSKTNRKNILADVFVAGKKIDIVEKFEYLGILIDTTFNFKSQIQKVCNRVRFNLSNFRFIRANLSLQAATMFMHAMILSHMTYCLTTWSQANKSALKPLESLYKQTIKVLDKKPIRHHHCDILQKHKLLSWENFIKYTKLCLFYKIIYGLSSPPLSQFVKIRSSQ
uniref:Reverse transcriptase domain-containing protein n=1 Tax=Oryzias latipes TaxID=8090 RepID=A0A3P9H9W6_ORYLA